MRSQEVTMNRPALGVLALLLALSAIPAAGAAPPQTALLPVSAASVSGQGEAPAPGAVIRGRILGLTPEDWPQVEILAVSQQAGAYVQTRLDSQGTYRIPDARPGEWKVLAQLSSGLVQGTVQIAAGEKEVVLDLEFPTGFTLTGRVLLAGKPVAGASIGLATDDRLPRDGMTGQDGTFRIERLKPGSYKMAIMLPTGTVLERTVEIDGDEEITVEIESERKQ
jgi:hypothetical protein